MSTVLPEHILKLTTPEVRASLGRTSKECRQCHTIFKVKPSHYDKKTYCSRTCMATNYRTRMTGDGNPRFGAAKHMKDCPVCGKTFNAVYHPSQKTCSGKCAARTTSGREHTARSMALATWARMAKRLRRLRKPFMTARLPKEKPIRTCSECGRGFPNRYNTKTCSKACYSVRLSQRQTGSKSHLWQGGKTSAAMKLRGSREYGAWRDTVFKRDDFACALCKKRGGKLAAHHIKPFSRASHLRLFVGNGITLCWPCHTSIRGKEAKYERRFFRIVASR